MPHCKEEAEDAGEPKREGLSQHPVAVEQLQCSGTTDLITSKVLPSLEYEITQLNDNARVSKVVIVERKCV